MEILSRASVIFEQNFLEMVYLDFISFVQGVRDPSLGWRALMSSLDVEPWRTSLDDEPWWRALMTSLDVEPWRTSLDVEPWWPEGSRKQEISRRANPGAHGPEEGFKLVYYVGKWLVDWIWILVVLMERCNKLQVIHEAAAQRRRSNNGCLLRLCATAFDSGDWWGMCQTFAWDWSLWRWTEKEEKSQGVFSL